MTLQNRVLPDNQITAQPWRGGFMGNKGGRIHDPQTKTLTRRKWASKRWICCVLNFKNRQRKVMGHSYTELFFLDEVSALACGHRPCFECRRADANLFAEIWENKFGPFVKSRADEMDQVLQSERIGARSFGKIDDLPSGAMIKQSDNFYAKYNDHWLRWSGEGYTKTVNLSGEAELLTPPSIFEVLRHNYQPKWHESAQ